MTVIIGLIGVFVCTYIGYVGHGGPLMVLYQPYEYVIIIGIGVCIVFTANPTHVLKRLLPKIFATVKGSGIEKGTYEDLLGLMASIFDTMRREGVLGIEEDLAEPHKSARFSKYPRASHNHHLMETLTGALRLFVDGVVNAFDLERLLDTEIETHHEEEMLFTNAVARVADALPAVGIVAAVLGIIITMQYLDQPPMIIGSYVAAALVGTMLGVFLAYAVVSPVAAKLESMAHENTSILKTVQAGLVSFAGGSPPLVALEFARKTIPSCFRPTAEELEALMKAAKK